jgi:hypothetical protein
MLRHVAFERTDVSGENRLQVTANVVPSSPVLVTLMMEVLSSSETSVLTRAIRRNIPEGVILHSHKICDSQLCKEHGDRIRVLPFFQNREHKLKTIFTHVRFEVFMAVTMKNGVFWVVTPCGSCKKAIANVF